MDRAGIPVSESRMQIYPSTVFVAIQLFDGLEDTLTIPMCCDLISNSVSNDAELSIRNAIPSHTEFGSIRQCTQERFHPSLSMLNSRWRSCRRCAC